MTLNVQGPNGPQGMSNVQRAEIINNNQYYVIPEGYYNDSLDLSSSPRMPQNIQQAFELGMYVGAARMQAEMGGARYNGSYPTQSQELQQIFNQCDMLLNSMYANQPSCGCRCGNDPLSDLRGLESLVNGAIRDARTPLPQEVPQNNPGNMDLEELQRMYEQMFGIESGNQSGNQSVQSAEAQRAKEQEEKMMAKIDRAATAIHDAFNDGSLTGTDEATVKQILEALSPEERAVLEIHYAEKYGNGNPDQLRDDIRDELSFMSPGLTEREALDKLNEGSSKTAISAAMALHDALDGPGTDEETVKQIMDSLSPQELQQVEAMYDKLYAEEGKTGQLRADIKDDFGFWDRFGGTATGAGIAGVAAAKWTAPLHAIPVVGSLSSAALIAGSSVIGGIWGFFAGDSSEEKNTYIGKLNQAALAD